MARIRWSRPPMPRSQMTMFTLEDALPANDPIRLFDQLLDQIDWTDWENHHQRRSGQPPIHPRLVAGAILYGLAHGLRSSRQLERATRTRLDLMWLLEGRTIDYSTFCLFRNNHAGRLGGLFDQLARVASAGVAGAGRNVAVDGTRARANSDRHGARTAAKLVERIEALASQKQHLLEQMDQRDAIDSADEALDAPAGETPQQLARQLERLEAEQAKMKRALEVANERDALKRHKDGRAATAVRVPVTDPDSTVMPHKEGGYGPNYTATAAVDEASGVILDGRVVEGSQETAAIMPALEATERIVGRRPEALMADGGFTSGAVLEDLEQAGVTLLAPAPAPVDPAVARPDPTVAVPEEAIERLPMNGRGDKRRLSARAFVYCNEEDVYYCPQGRVLRPEGGQTRDKSGRTIQRYRCEDCAGCPLAARCLSGAGARRWLSRDQYQELRDELSLRMSREPEQALYRRRAPVGEGPFGIIKHVMGVRQFYYRGRSKVGAEWCWICMGFNVIKFLRRRQAEAARLGPDGDPRRPRRAKRSSRRGEKAAARGKEAAARGKKSINGRFLVPIGFAMESLCRWMGPICHCLTKLAPPRADTILPGFST